MKKIIQEYWPAFILPVTVLFFITAFLSPKIMERIDPPCKIPWKSFLLTHPEYTFYEKDKPQDVFRGFIDAEDEVIGIQYNQEPVKFIFTEDTTKYPINIGKIDSISVDRVGRLFICEKEEQNKTEGAVMSYSIFDVLVLVILIFIVAKGANKITWRSIFKPLKKTSKEIKSEWDKS